MLTPSEARRISEENMVDNLKRGLDELDTLIRKAAREGHTALVCFPYNYRIKERLSRDGFKVQEMAEDQKTWWKISW